MAHNPEGQAVCRTNVSRLVILVFTGLCGSSFSLTFSFTAHFTICLGMNSIVKDVHIRVVVLV